MTCLVSQNRVRTKIRVFTLSVQCSNITECFFFIYLNDYMISLCSVNMANYTDLLFFLLYVLLIWRITLIYCFFVVIIYGEFKTYKDRRM